MCAICFVLATCALDKILIATTKPESRCLAIGTIPNDPVPMIGPSSKFRMGVFGCMETLFGFGSKTSAGAFSAFIAAAGAAFRRGGFFVLSRVSF